MLWLGDQLEEQHTKAEHYREAKAANEALICRIISQNRSLLKTCRSQQALHQPCTSEVVPCTALHLRSRTTLQSSSRGALVTQVNHAACRNNSATLDRNCMVLQMKCHHWWQAFRTARPRSHCSGCIMLTDFGDQELAGYLKLPISVQTQLGPGELVLCISAGGVLTAGCAGEGHKPCSDA